MSMPTECANLTPAIAVVTSNATRSVLDVLAAAYERERGERIAIESDSASVMLERIKGGERADAAVLNAPDIDSLVDLGIIDARTRRSFARSRIGVAVRAGAPHPDIHDVEAVRRTFLQARAIAHTVHGASGRCVPGLLDRLGIAQRVRTITRPGGLIAKLVASGEAELAVQQISELLAVPGVELVGPLPHALQTVFESAVGVFSASSRRAEALQFLDYLTAPAAANVLEEKGLERPLEEGAGEPGDAWGRR